MSCTPVLNIGDSPSFSKEQIEKLSDQVQITDKDEDSGLINYCYAPNINIAECTDEVKKCRGVIFDKNGKLILNAFSYTPEYDTDDTDIITNFVNIGGGVHESEGENNLPAILRGIEKCSFYETYEGALLRVFNYNGKWFISTHRKLNAFKSKWGGPQSYGTSFKQGVKFNIDNNPDLESKLSDTTSGFLTAFLDTLDTDNSYMFLVRNTDQNRLVCLPPINQEIYHVGTFKNGSDDICMEDDIGIQKPKKYNFNHIDDVYNHVNSRDPSMTPGVIVFTPDNKQFKISSPEYLNLLKVRGNQPSINFRYLEIRNDRHMNDTLRYLYPDSVVDFDKYENIIYNDVVPFIHNAYMSRFIKKEHATVPPPEYRVIKEAHSWYSEDRDNRKVTKSVISEILNNQRASTINKMVKRVLYPDQRHASVPSYIDNKFRQMNVKDSPADEIKNEVEGSNDAMDIV